MRKTVLVIVGPTGSGKSSLALRLAKKLDGVIINADSRQVYRGMTIGTNKDAGTWTDVHGKQTFVVDGIPEYCVDYIEPDQAYTVADWLKDATAAIRATKKFPIVVGGTGLYTSALVHGYTLGARDESVRAALEERLETEGLESLVFELEEADPEVAAKTDLKNPRRVIRALEQELSTGDAASTQPSTEFDFVVCGVTWPREVLNKRIDERVDAMMAAGLVDEVKALHAKGYPVDSPAMTGIGYRQIVAYLEGKMTLPEAIELIKRDTRRYAKRQMTWYRREVGIQWVHSVEDVLKLL